MTWRFGARLPRPRRIRRLRPKGRVRDGDFGACPAAGRQPDRVNCARSKYLRRNTLCKCRKLSANPQGILLVVVLVIVIETSQVEHEDENDDEDGPQSRSAESIPEINQRIKLTHYSVRFYARYRLLVRSLRPP